MARGLRSLVHHPVRATGVHRGGGGGGGGYTASSCLWSNVSEINDTETCEATISKPHEYSGWTEDENHLLMGWFRIGNWTTTTERILMGCAATTYGSGIGIGYEYLSGDHRFYSWAHTNSGYKQGNWNDDPNTNWGSDVDGNADGAIDDYQWVHIAYYASWSAQLYINGVRTWNGHQSSHATWSANPGSTNGYQNQYWCIGGWKHSNSYRYPANNFGVANVCHYLTNDITWTDWSSYTSKDPALPDGDLPKMIAWHMDHHVTGSEDGLLYGWPLKTDGTDVGPYSKDMVPATAGTEFTDSHTPYGGGDPIAGPLMLD